MDLIDLSKSPEVTQKCCLVKSSEDIMPSEEDGTVERKVHPDEDLLADVFKPVQGNKVECLLLRSVEKECLISPDDVIKDLRKIIKVLQAVPALTLKEKERIEHLLRSLQYDVTKKYNINEITAKNFLGFSRSRKDRSQKHQLTIKKATVEKTLL